MSINEPKKTALHCPDDCPNTNQGDCPICYLATGLGCPHGLPCEGCLVDHAVEGVAAPCAQARVRWAEATRRPAYTAKAVIDRRSDGSAWPPRVCGIGADDGAAWENARAQKGAALCADARFVDATDAALRTWDDGDPDVYFAVDGVVRANDPDAPEDTPKAVVLKGAHPTICGMGRSTADAWADARMNASEVGDLEVLRGAASVEATHAALRAWEDEDRRERGDGCSAYLAEDGVVRLPRNEGCTPEKPCRACDGCLYEAEDVTPPQDDEDDESGAVSTFMVELVVRGDPGDAAQALKLALDDGVLQDAINAYDSDNGGVRVTSAVQRWASEPGEVDARCLVTHSPMQGRSAVDYKQYVGADDASGAVIVPVADVVQPGAQPAIVGIEIHKLPPDPAQPGDGNWLGYSPVWTAGTGYEHDDIHTSLRELCADYGIPLDLVVDRMAVALLRPAAPKAPAPALIVVPSGAVVGSGADQLHAWADARSEHVDLEGARCVGLSDVPNAGQPGGPCITAPGVPCSCDDCIVETRPAGEV